jgi:hypothetical protein
MATNDGAEPLVAPLLNVRQIRQSRWLWSGGQAVLA